MAELRKILAEIENKTITEALVSRILGGGAAEQILKDGVTGLAKQGAKTIIKQLGEEVTVNVIRRVGKKKIEQEVELVLKKVADQDSYLIVLRNGKQPQKTTILSAEQVADDVEKAVVAGRSVKLSGELQVRASSELAQQAVKDANNMTDAQLEAAIKDTDRSPAIRREFKAILDQRKASKTGDSESLKREAERGAKDIAGKTDADLQALYNNPNVTAAQRKAAKEELERRGIKPEAPKTDAPKPAEAPRTEPEAPKAGSQEAANLERARVDYKKLSDSELQTIYNGRDEMYNSWQKQAAKETLESRGIKPGVTKVEPAPEPKVNAPKTADDVLQAKKTAAAEAEAKAAIDAGEVKIKEADLLPAKPGETASERLKRTLEEKPEIVDKWNSLKGTKGEEGFWQYVKRRKVATLVTALTVAAIAAGVYNSGAEPEEVDNAAEPAEIGDDEPEELDDEAVAAAAAKKKAEADAAKKKADAANSEAGQSASTTTEKDGKETDGKETDGKETDGVADNSAEQQELLTQINALIAKLSKSKDPAIQKRLAAVRKKLGQTDQAASVVSKDEPYVASGWYDIGQGYRRWYGKDGVDPTTGRKVTTGTTDITPSDGVQHRDKYANMSQLELANLARRNAASGNPAKTKSNWENK